MKKNLSIAIATFNEAENIDACLSAAKDITDEIVVVDGGSSDRTTDIAKKYGAIVIQTDNPPIFHINKQKALDACHGTWILQLDADEIVTPELAREIKGIVVMNNVELDNYTIDQTKKTLFLRHQKLIEERDGSIGSPDGSIVAFFVPRRNYFLGKSMKYGGMYPDGVIRLVKRGFARFPSKSVHEQIEISGRVSWLNYDLIHQSNPTFSKYFKGAGAYTTLQAQALQKNKTPKNIVGFIHYFFIKPTQTFVDIFFRHKGFLDGLHGFLFALFSSFHFPIAFYKYVFMS